MVVVVVVAVASSAPGGSWVGVEWVGEGQLGVGLVRHPPLQVPVAPHPLPDADSVEDAGQGQDDHNAPVDDDACAVRYCDKTGFIFFRAAPLPWRVCNFEAINNIACKQD